MSRILTALLLHCALAGAGSATFAQGGPLAGDSALPPGLADWRGLREDAARGELALDEDGVPVGIDASRVRRSRDGAFTASALPDLQPLPLQAIHAWDLVLRDAGDRPVEGATVRVYGGMPLHDHGFPTAPSVVEVGAGRYRIEGMKFHMAGWWQMILLITAGETTDAVTFEVPVRYEP